MLNVADISVHNSNYTTAINENDAVIVKITEGLSYVNPLANEQYQAAKSAGKLVGIYHFIVGGLDSAAQADYFYQNAKNYADEDGTVLVLDWERPKLYPNLSGDEPVAFLERLRALTGKTGLLYIGHEDVVNGAYNWSDIAGKYSLWVAGYPLNNGAPYTSDLQAWADRNYFSNPAYNGQAIAMWQYDSEPYDRSVFYGNRDAWLAIGTVGGQVQPEQTTKKAQVKDMLLFKSDINTKFGDAANVYFLNSGTVIKVDSGDTFNQLKANGVPFAVFTMRNTESLINANGGLK